MVGERTVAAARGAFEFAEPVRVEAKGKPGGVVCRRLVRALSLMRPRGISGLQPVFVGRGGELADLQHAYGLVVTSARPHLVTVVGDAGVGKTRLVREFWRWLGGIRTGRCCAAAGACPTVTGSRTGRWVRCSRSTSGFWTAIRRM